MKDNMKKIVALAGNPNVGKSTVFNELTGMRQHTGNWPGKTVSNASGICTYRYTDYKIYDLPGTYSLIAHSKEEEVARDFLCFEEHDAVVVVCDAICLERNLNLVLQTLEITDNVVVCVNLLDEAKKKKIKIDLKKLSEYLGVPVVGTTARNKNGLDKLMETVDDLIYHKEKEKPITIEYDPFIEKAIAILEEPMKKLSIDNSRWLAMQLLDNDDVLNNTILKKIDIDLSEEIENARIVLMENGLKTENLKDKYVLKISNKAEEICKTVVTYGNENFASRDRKIDKILTSRITGIPIMIGLLMLVFWITISGANYPSSVLFSFFSNIEEYLINFFNYINFPIWLTDMLVLGVYRVLSWVVAVMLPPMAIFFPLFTILEDLGYLPRIAFNLDNYFKKCSACGKQALTMTMGFGCNAVGVTGCRIIDSPRERLIAILTNSFVPCNGRFPTLITIITIFFVGFATNLSSSILSVTILTLVILLGIFITFIVSKLLSKTILRGIPSSFTLELPPYRKPQFGKLIIRSIFDRTLYVLGRAITIAAPAGLIIWVMANINIDGTSIFNLCSNFLDPFGHMIGLDGVIVLAFLLGFPANEIVLPLIIMGYLSNGTISEFDNLVQIKQILVDNGWTWLTAISMMIICLLHFPCSTTCLTIKKETGKWSWVLVSILIPTILGIAICLIITTFVRYFGIL